MNITVTTHRTQTLIFTQENRNHSMILSPQKASLSLFIISDDARVTFTNENKRKETSSSTYLEHYGSKPERKGEKRREKNKKTGLENVLKNDDVIHFRCCRCLPIRPKCPPEILYSVFRWSFCPKSQAELRYPLSIYPHPNSRMPLTNSFLCVRQASRRRFLFSYSSL